MRGSTPRRRPRAAVTRRSPRMPRLLPLGVLMLIIGYRVEGAEIDMIPAFRLRDKFAVTFGVEFASNSEIVRNACRTIGALKLLVVANIWLLRNPTVMLVLAGFAVPCFALVIYSHIMLGEDHEPTVVALIFAVLIPRAALLMMPGSAPAPKQD